MTYYYKVTVKFTKGKTDFIKKYKCDFLHIGCLFVYLEQKHHDNYTLIDIKKIK